MATIWQKRTKYKHYEVRKAGNSTRLYTNGVFHSQYNPNHLVSRGVWDLLFLPVFFLPAEKLKRVLVLGVGGGAAIQLLNRYVKPEQIIGVELDAIHLSIAKRFFKVAGKNIKLVQTDAIKWLASYRGPQFDLIIDDLFFEQEGMGQRAIDLDSSWFSLIEKRLNDHGLLIANTFSHAELSRSAFCCDLNVAQRFSDAYAFQLERFDNVVGAFLKETATVGQLRKRLGQTEGLNKKSGADALKFRVKRLKGAVAP